ncbi:MAG: hypothetical protein IKP96_00600 [Elusimicrobiaceae bacterium]|nr:hypothetical protein [Elusimicrobiaceae bacterium]
MNSTTRWVLYFFIIVLCASVIGGVFYYRSSKTISDSIGVVTDIPAVPSPTVATTATDTLPLQTIYDPVESVSDEKNVADKKALPPVNNSDGQVSVDAKKASHAKYIEGLDAFNRDEFERARQAWIMAKQLDPENNDAELGLRKIEEVTR